jgi:hypothetical protein
VVAVEVHEILVKTALMVLVVVAVVLKEVQTLALQLTIMAVLAVQVL